MTEIAHVKSYTKSKKIMVDNMLTPGEIRHIIFKINKTKKSKKEELNLPEFVEL